MFFVFFLMENWVVEDPPSHLNGKFHYFFWNPSLRDGFKKKLMEFSIKLAGWVLDDPIFH